MVCTRVSYRFPNIKMWLLLKLIENFQCSDVYNSNDFSYTCTTLSSTDSAILQLKSWALVNWNNFCISINYKRISINQHAENFKSIWKLVSIAIQCSIIQSIKYDYYQNWHHNYLFFKLSQGNQTKIRLFKPLNWIFSPIFLLSKIWRSCRADVTSMCKIIPLNRNDLIITPREKVNS